MRTTSHRSSVADRLPVPRTPEQEDLAAALTGVLLLPGDQGFDEVAPTGGGSGPAAVVVAGDAADVALAVHWARQSGLRLAVRSAASGAVDAGPGALLVTTTGLTDVRVDAAAGTAEVGAGVRRRELLAAAAPYGLGPAGDRVLALDVVTADGVRRRVSARASPDLFRALHGGLGTLAVVTGVELGLVPVVGGGEADDLAADPVLAALVHRPAAAQPAAAGWEQLVRRYDPDRLLTAPDAVSGS